MTDAQTTLFECKQAVETFLTERDWHQFHSPKIDSMGLVVEAGELLELFLFCQPNDGGRRVLIEKREFVEDEVADCFFWVLCFANTASIDLAKAVTVKSNVMLNFEETHMTLTDLKKIIGQSGARYTTVTDNAVNISCKASLLMNRFLEEALDGTGRHLLGEKKNEIEELLVDVLVAIIKFTESLSIDISTAFARKLEKNAKKYPIEKSKGTSKKYTDL